MIASRHVLLRDLYLARSSFAAAAAACPTPPVPSTGSPRRQTPFGMQSLLLLLPAWNSLCPGCSAAAGSSGGW